MRKKLCIVMILVWIVLLTTCQWNINDRINSQAIETAPEVLVETPVDENITESSVPKVVPIIPEATATLRPRPSVVPTETATEQPTEEPIQIAPTSTRRVIDLSTSEDETTVEAEDEQTATPTATATATIEATATATVESVTKATATATSTFTPTPTPTIDATATAQANVDPLEIEYKISWRLDPQNRSLAIARVVIDATGGDGNYLYYRDGLKQSGNEFEYRWRTCQPSIGTFLVTSGKQSADIPFAVEAPCP